MKQGRQLRGLYRFLGFTRVQLATFLQVSERAIYRWEAGQTRIPVAVMKLLRLHAGHELPGKTWAGWHFSRDTLWTPEGHGFTGQDFAWLSMTVRRSAMFAVLYRERSELRAKLLEARQALAKAEEEAITAEGRAGVLELAIWGVLARERRGLSVSGGPGHRAERAPGETRTLLRKGVVTPSESLTGETDPALWNAEELLEADAATLPDGTVMPWRVSISTDQGGHQ